VIRTTPIAGWPVACIVAALLCAMVACDKPQPPPPNVLPASEKVAPTSPVGTNQTILQKTFALKSSVDFPFEVPAHAVRPHLHGIFESFVGQVHGTSDETANIDFLIVNEQQYADLTSNRPSEALMSVEGSHSQAVNFDLPASMNQPVKYYLVFHNTSKTGKVIEANFRVDF
jgi:hypothetical protein